MKDLKEARKQWHSRLTNKTANTTAFKIKDFKDMLDKFCLVYPFSTDGLRHQVRQTLGKEFLWRDEEKFFANLDEPEELDQEEFLSRRHKLLTR